MAKTILYKNSWRVSGLSWRLPVRHPDDPGSNPELMLCLLFLSLADAVIRKARKSDGSEVKWIWQIRFSSLLFYLTACEILNFQTSTRDFVDVFVSSSSRSHLDVVGVSSCRSSCRVLCLTSTARQRRLAARRTLTQQKGRRSSRVVSGPPVMGSRL